jgi:hypothetical protein
MPSFGILRRVALVRIDVSEERIAASFGCYLLPTLFLAR